MWGAVVIILCGLVSASFSSSMPLERISLPEGFSIGLFVSDIPDARSLAMGPQGVLFIGNRQGDKVWAVVDTNEDGSADQSMFW